MNSSWRTTIYTIILAFVLGGASGVLGTAWTSSYLSDYAVKLNELTVPLRYAQEKPRNFPASYREAVGRFTESSLPSVAELYSGSIGQLGYSKENIVGRGVVLTADGWIAVFTDVDKVRILKSSAVKIGDKLFPVTGDKYDSIGKLLFLKIDANNLSVASFGKGGETKLGEQVFIADFADSFSSSSVTRHIWPDSRPVSSDEPNHMLQIANILKPGSIVFNLNGEVIGFADGAQVVPFETIQPAFKSLLETKNVSRPILGVTYIDLAHAVKVSDTISRGNQKGALLYGTSAVKWNGPAKIAGLLSGDILLLINGELINESKSLNELISQYKAGDKISVLFDRDDSTQTVEVTLGEIME